MNFLSAEGSEALKARVRSIRDEMARDMAVALAEGIGRKAADSAAQLAASLLLATWSVALIQAHATFRQKRDARAAGVVFLAVIDQGTLGLKAAMAGTPYV